MKYYQIQLKDQIWYVIDGRKFRTLKSVKSAIKKHKKNCGYPFRIIKVTIIKL